MKTKLTISLMLLATCLPLCADEAQTTPPAEDPCAFCESFNGMQRLIALKEIADLTSKVTVYNKLFSLCSDSEQHQLEYLEWLLVLKAFVDNAYDAATAEFASDETINALLDLAKLYTRHAQMIIDQTMAKFPKLVEDVNYTVEILLQNREAVLKARAEKLAQEVGPEVAAKVIEEMNTLQGAVEPKTEVPVAPETVALPAETPVPQPVPAV